MFALDRNGQGAEEFAFSANITKEGFYEKDTVSGRCSGDDGSSNPMCLGSSKVAGI